MGGSARNEQPHWPTATQQSEPRRAQAVQQRRTHSGAAGHSQRRPERWRPRRSARGAAGPDRTCGTHPPASEAEQISRTGAPASQNASMYGREHGRRGRQSRAASVALTVLASAAAASPLQAQQRSRADSKSRAEQLSRQQQTMQTAADDGNSRAAAGKADCNRETATASHE